MPIKRWYAFIFEYYPPLVIFLLALLFFSPTLTGSRYHFAADFLKWFYPWRHAFVGADSGACIFLKNNTLLDTIMVLYPQDCFFNSMLKQGIMPLWDPYIFCGHPLQAAGFPSTVYPLRIVFHYLFSPLLARELLMFIHLFLAGLFAYFYLRSLHLSKFSALLGGTVWMLGGFSILYLQFEIVTMMAAHIPLALFFIERLAKTISWRYCGALALVVCSSVFVGHWQYVIYGLLIMGSYAAFRAFSFPRDPAQGSRAKCAFLLAFSLLLGITAAAVQLLPSMELFSLGQRPVFSRIELFSLSRFLPENLLTLFHPDILGHPSHQFFFTRIRNGTMNYLELCPYMGILPLVLALYGSLQKNRATLFFAILGFLSLLYAMGAPVVNLLYYVMPGFKSLTPTRTIFIFTFCIAMLSAFGMDRLEREGMPPRLIQVFLAFWSFFTFLLGAFCILMQSDQSFLRGVLAFYSSGSLFMAPNYCADRGAFVVKIIESVLSHYSFFNAYLMVPLLMGWSGLLIFVLNKRGLIKESGFKIALFLVIACDLLYFGMKFNCTCARQEVFPSCHGLSHLVGKSREPYRVAGLIRMAHPDGLLPYEIQDVAGYASMFPRDYSRLMTALAGEPQSYLMNDLHDGRCYRKPMADFLNVRYHYTDPLRTLEPARGNLVYDADLRIYENKGYLERFFLVPQAIVEKDHQKVLDRMVSKEFDPVKGVYLEEEPESRGSEKMEGKVEIVSYNPTHIKLKVRCSARAFIVNSDTYYPGWKAFIDGQKTRVYRANYCFRAISLPAGTHDVEFRFEPAAFRQGLVISIICIILCLVMLFLKREDNLPSPAPPAQATL
jgi:hypothetical protein